MPVSTNSDPLDAEPYEPTDEEAAQMVASSPDERAAAQEMVLRACSSHWQKVAKLVGDLSDDFIRRYPHLPFAYLQATMQRLEDDGKVELAGDVWAMRHSEIRLAPRRSGPREV